ncbi:type II toxin-antitoxin system death-on-curing family toxin [Nocardia sp. BSTN01]|uniref:type II toxin-antitoxin system death-on-curing family toxin n=1 Tax=Nocardia sp. BSTN01 TaxID=2783665 RepID=UPI00188F74D9|nr:type II toxin-antitoxin system death-on-curing family toxin [Nocardia sp. BSTN01]MBF5001168.1 type II toxin-antitoxin system death-on-curing family toxin [Nocardia sp. BSTN01]
MTEPSIYYLTMADLRAIGGDAVGPFSLRDPGLLASAIARPQATIFGADAYPTIWEKASALLHSIAGNHPLIDGNKRLAVSAAVVFLARNGIDVDRLDEDHTYDLMIEVAKGQLVEIADIAARLVAALGHTR